jgi:hypothetical protein
MAPGASAAHPAAGTPSTSFVAVLEHGFAATERRAAVAP